MSCDDGTVIAIGQHVVNLKRGFAELPTGTLEQILAKIGTITNAEAAKYAAAMITPVIDGRLAQLRPLGKDAATAGVARILANREERQERVVGEEEDVGALRREVTDLRQRMATLERLLGNDGSDEDGSDDDLIGEDVDGVLV